MFTFRFQVLFLIDAFQFVKEILILFSGLYTCSSKCYISLRILFPIRSQVAQVPSLTEKRRELRRLQPLIFRAAVECSIDCTIVA